MINFQRPLRIGWPSRLRQMRLLISPRNFVGRKLSALQEIQFGISVFKMMILLKLMFTFILRLKFELRKFLDIIPLFETYWAVVLRKPHGLTALLQESLYETQKTYL